MMYSPLGAYVSFAQRRRERIIAGAIGIVLGLAAAGTGYLIFAAF